MKGARGNGLHRSEHVRRWRCRASGRGAVAKRALGIVAPAADTSGCHHYGARVRNAGRDGRYSGEHVRRERSRATCRGAVAKLAPAVVTPTPNAAGRCQCAGERVAGNDGLNTREQIGRGWCGYGWSANC